MSSAPARATAPHVPSPALRCPSCGTAYRVDPTKVPESGARARCSVCSQVLIIRRRSSSSQAHAVARDAPSETASEPEPRERPRGVAAPPPPPEVTEQAARSESPAPHPAPPSRPPRESRRVAVTESSRGQRVFAMVLVVIWLVVAGTVLYWGLPYYATPLQDRAYSELHDAFKPSGTVGNMLGVVGSALMMVGVGLYSLRKRVSRLARVGKLRYWLQFHIFLCTLGPFLVVLHTSFKFGGIVSIAFWSMIAVVASGVFGRYIYARIPKTINGQFLSLQAVERQKGDLVATIRERSGLSTAEVAGMLSAPQRRTPRGFVHALWVALRFDLAGRRQRRRVRRLLIEKRVSADMRDTLVALVQTRFQLEQQLVLLQPFQRLFRYWHLFHLPLAIVMFAIMIVHIVVAVLFGYGWGY